MFYKSMLRLRTSEILLGMGYIKPRSKPGRQRCVFQLTEL